MFLTAYFQVLLKNKNLINTRKLHGKSGRI